MSNKIKDAVQPLKWYSALPRKAYETLPLVEQSQPWFEVYRLPNDIYAIYEPCHFQEVISYLIIGSEKVLLLDTGMGIGNIYKLVKELTSLPIDVVNSHCHFDHIGDNWQFDCVYIYHHQGALNRLRTGLPLSEVSLHLLGDSTWKPYPVDFDEQTYHIKPCTPIAINDGHIFNLGNRQLQVVHTPGHSPDSIMLLEEATSTLFTGDTFYPATLYAHLDCGDGIVSHFETYQKTMNHLVKTISVNTLLTSHNEPIIQGNTLQIVANSFNAIANNNLSYQTDESGLRKYTFDGFAIVTNNPPTN